MHYFLKLFEGYDVGYLPDKILKLIHRWVDHDKHPAFF